LPSFLQRAFFSMDWRHSRVGALRFADPRICEKLDSSSGARICARLSKGWRLALTGLSPSFGMAALKGGLFQDERCHCFTISSRLAIIDRAIEYAGCGAGLMGRALVVNDS